MDKEVRRHGLWLPGLLLFPPLLQGANLLVGVGGRHGTILGDALHFAAALLASIFLTRAARHSRAGGAPDAACWFLFAAGTVSWCVAALLLLVREAVLRAPFFGSPPDIFFAAFFPFSSLGLLLIPRASPQPGETIDTLLDAATLVAAIFGIAWVLESPAMLGQLLGNPRPQALLILAYSVLNGLLTAALCWTAIRRLSATVASLPVGLLMGGTAFVVLGDWEQAAQLVTGGLCSSPRGLFHWTLALALLGTAGLAKLGELSWLSTRWARGMALLKSRSGIVLAVTHLWTLLALLLLIVGLFFPTSSQTSPIVPITMLVVSLVGMRQVRGLQENERLNRELSDVNGRLEKANGELLELNRAIKAEAEEQARDFEERLKELFVHAPYGIFILRSESEGRIAVDSANPALERILKMNVEQLRQATGRAVLPGTTVDLARKHIFECMNQGKPVEYEFSIAFADCTTTLFATLFPIRNSEGRVHRLAGFMQDITDRKRAEDALAESEEKFSRIFRMNPDAVALIDLDAGRIIDANDAMPRMHGFTREEVLTQTVDELKVWDPRERSRVHDILRAQGGVRNFEARLRRKDGSTIECLYSADMIELHGKRVAIAIARDITDFKRMHDERDRARALEQQLREDFTRKLIASQEAERKRIASDLHDSLGQDLLLVKNRLHLVAKAYPATAAQLGAIEELSAASLAEVRRISKALRPYNIDTVGVTQALRSMARGAEENVDFALELELDDVDDVVKGDDAINLFRIVQEGLNNIIKHAEAKNVRVSLERDVKDLQLTIEDDGRGFDLGQDPLKRPSNGLGLRNMAERAHIMGGSISFNSVIGSGTRISVILPLREEDGQGEG